MMVIQNESHTTEGAGCWTKGGRIFLVSKNQSSCSVTAHSLFCLHFIP